MRPARERVRKWAAWAAELGAAFALVVLCFVIFLGVLGLSFPHGTSLRDLMGYGGGDEARGGSALSVDVGPAAASRPRPLVASLARVFRRVTDREPDALVWSEARPGTALQDRHAVQTFSRSGATIVFGDNHGLQLSEKSLIILKRLEQEPEKHMQRAALVLMEGELSARFEPHGREQRAAVEITTPQGQFDVATSGRAAADFRLTAVADRASTLAVYAGEASVTALGQTVVVPPDHAVTVLPGQTPGVPVRLAARPVASAPLDDAVHRFREEAAEVRFAWAAQPDAEQYRFVLARDPDFSEIVHDRRLEQNDFTHAHLVSGTYYWKVSALRGGIEGPQAAPRKLTVLQDREPPALRVEAVPEVVHTSTIVLRGTTEPESRVWVGEREAPIEPGGAFAIELALEAGMNVIVIEAIDPPGNVAYHSLLLNAKFAEKTP